MRFLVDENLPSQIAAVLTRAGHDVLDVAASSLRGSTDESLWQHAVREQRIIVTRDLDYPLVRIAEMPAGLMLIRTRPEARLAEITALFESFAGHVDWPTLLGSITVVEPGRLRQRRLGTIRTRR